MSFSTFHVREAHEMRPWIPICLRRRTRPPLLGVPSQAVDSRSRQIAVAAGAQNRASQPINGMLCFCAHLRKPLLIGRSDIAIAFP